MPSGWADGGECADAMSAEHGGGRLVVRAAPQPAQPRLVPRPRATRWRALAQPRRGPWRADSPHHRSRRSQARPLGARASTSKETSQFPLLLRHKTHPQRASEALDGHISRSRGQNRSTRFQLSGGGSTRRQLRHFTCEQPGGPGSPAQTPSRPEATMLSAMLPPELVRQSVQLGRRCSASVFESQCRTNTTCFNSHCRHLQISTPTQSHSSARRIGLSCRQ
jgi:hypothetical protein